MKDVLIVGLLHLVFSSSASARETHSYTYNTQGGMAEGSLAEMCGKVGNKAGLHLTSGGMTYCGASVGTMVSCMKNKNFVKDRKDCSCGDGEDWNGNKKCTEVMDACGYEKAKDMDECIKTPGAVLSYKFGKKGDCVKDEKHSSCAWSTNGQKHGHVEFNCGTKEKPAYCSVYANPENHDKPWPRGMPDFCWVPKGAKSK
jgi:hypothetical protein